MGRLADATCRSNVQHELMNAMLACCCRGVYFRFICQQKYLPHSNAWLVFMNAHIQSQEFAQTAVVQ